MATVNKKGKVFAMLSGIVIGLILAIIVLVVVCVVFFHKNTNVPNTDPQATVDSVIEEPEQGENEPTQDALAPEQDVAVDTPVCTLYYPAKWKDRVRVEQVDLGYGYVARFFGSSNGNEAELFSILFGEGTEKSARIGAVIQNGIAMDVHLEIADFSEDHNWDTTTVDELMAMQTDADYLIGRLKENVFFQNQETPEEDIVPDTSDASLKTPYGTLHYSGEWKDAVTWDISTEKDICTVSVMESFSGMKAPVFILSFNNPEDMGFQMGTLHQKDRDVAVCVTLCDFPQGNTWTDSEKNLFLKLQEQAYDMLERFAEDNSSYTSVFEME